MKLKARLKRVGRQKFKAWIFKQGYWKGQGNACWMKDAENLLKE